MPDAKPKVLIVEDDPFMTQLLSEELSRQGFHVILATDGEAAIAKFSAERPDVLVVDILLPLKSGLEALGEIRLLPGGDKVPAIILSNLEEQVYRAEAEKLGVKAYLVKAKTELTEVAAKVKEALGQAKD